MKLPLNLVSVRHGQSKLNEANKRSRNGDNSLFTPAFLKTHSSEAALTPLGYRQATAAGLYIRTNIAASFDRYYCSPYVRAYETALFLGFTVATWQTEHDLRERDWGEIDVMPNDVRLQKYTDILSKMATNPYTVRPPRGESIEDTQVRVRRILRKLSLECPNESVIIVWHGEMTWTLRTILENITQDEYLRLMNSSNPFNRIHTCQILHYTRINPWTGEEAPTINWMRSICPTDLTLSSNEWQTITK